MSKSSAISGFEVSAGIIVFLIGFGGFGAYRLDRLYGEAIYAPKKATVVFTEKTTLIEAGSKLISKGLFLDKKEWVWAAKIYGYHHVQPGSYTFKGSFSYYSALEKLSSGSQDPVSVTVLPGIDLQTFAESVAAKLALKPDSLLKVLEDEAFLRRFGTTKTQAPGRLLPETYQFYWTTGARTVVARIFEEFDRKTSGIDFTTANKRGLRPAEVITLASIVEWESKDPEERRMIAGLYLNRLKKGMRLQADPTVAFAVGARRRLTFQDYRFEHPYNTYQNNGLPPGPINNPSLSSIKAVVNPVDHKFIYMVASPTGKHVFTSTWEEHKAESEKWRRWLRKQYKIKQERERQSG